MVIFWIHTKHVFLINRKFYWKAITLSIYGIQVDIQAAIIISSKNATQLSFQHVYFTKLTPAGSDQSDSDSNTSANNPCLPNPCLNQGLCQLSINYTYTCLCTILWSGKFFSLVYSIILNKNIKVLLVNLYKRLQPHAKPVMVFKHLVLQVIIHVILTLAWMVGRVRYTMHQVIFVFVFQDLVVRCLN